MTINGIQYKKFNNDYYVSEFGDVYSCLSNKNLKHYIDKDGYHRVDIYINHKPKHFKVHKLVYLTWKGKIEQGKQINHYDDDKNNNHYTNLYLGTQKDNVLDCIKNGHKYINAHTIVIYDKKINKILCFSPMSDFLKYAGHPQSNGGVSRVFDKKWFKENYELIYIERSVTTTGDECSPVE